MHRELDLNHYPLVAAMQEALSRQFSYFASIFARQYSEFGDEWLNAFEVDMRTFFGNDRQRLERAVYGYGCFALDGMKLQKEFDKTRRYRAKTYAEAANAVYQNRDYMFDLYLPGILISHFLWRHHYRQHVFFTTRFVPLLKRHGGRLFYDIGVGTGFYSKEMLRVLPDARGEGFDLSPFALEHTTEMLQAWGFADRYTPHLRDIIADPIDTKASFIVNVEVLEHLEDPQAFLHALFAMLEDGGHGFISAAITAPNADHIYLYNSTHDVIVQLEAAGFKLVAYAEEPAYSPRQPTDSVPINGAFIVTK